MYVVKPAQFAGRVDEDIEITVGDVRYALDPQSGGSDSPPPPPPPFSPTTATENGEAESASELPWGLGYDADSHAGFGISDLPRAEHLQDSPSRFSQLNARPG